MKKLTFLGSLIILGLVIFVLPGLADVGEPLPKGADTQFIGTVTAIGEATFSAVPRSSDVIIVRVDRVIQEPQTIDLQEQEKITLKVKKVSDFKLGMQGVFYATSWMVGDGVALVEVGHQFVPHVGLSKGNDLEGVTNKVKQKIEAQKQSDLKNRIDSAKLVLVGRILSVQPTQGNEGRATLQGGHATAKHREYTSEHDPQWKDAIVQVESMIKGNPNTSQVIVRFPGSPDVAWRYSPKLKEGQEATLILQQATESGAATMSRGTRAYSAGSKADVLSKDDAALVRQLAK
jgi:hypothetical protein